MKYVFTLVISFILFTTNIMYSQTCLENGIVFESQTDIDQFSTQYPNCKEILGSVSLKFDGNNPIINLEGLRQIQKIYQYLSIYDIDQLENLEGLNSLSYIGEGLALSENDQLSNLDGLANLTHIGNKGIIRLKNNKNLSDISGLSGIHSFESHLEIINNPRLKSIESLGFVSDLDDRLEISFNDSLTSLSGLENIGSIGGNFYIGYNNQLSDISALSNLTSIGSSAIVTSNPALIDLNGFNNLETIGKYLYIYDNDLITNLDPLSKLKSLGGHISIWDNDQLANIEGIKNLNSSSVKSNYPTFYKDISIFNNINLSSCHVKSVCDILSNPNTTSQISNNGIGCKNLEEVLISCTVATEDYTNKTSSCKVFPNPSSGNFSLVLSDNWQFCTVEIFDLRGRLLLEKSYTNDNIYDFDPSINSGSYIMKISSLNENPIIKKIVIIK